jgi:hypothetical protein
MASPSSRRSLALIHFTCICMSNCAITSLRGAECLLRSWQSPCVEPEGSSQELSCFTSNALRSLWNNEGYWLDARGIVVRFPEKTKRFFSSPNLPYRLWGLFSLLFTGYWRLCAGGMWPGCLKLTTHPYLLLSFRNAWFYVYCSPIRIRIPTPNPTPPPSTFMACALLFYYLHISLFASATGVWCCRRTGKVSCTDHVRNEEVL